MLQVGDIESGPFLEALRQFQFRVGRENICIIFVTFVPVLSGEQKSKPTQAGVRGKHTQPHHRSTCICWDHPLATPH